MRILLICLALLIASPAYAQLPVSGQYGYVSGLVCMNERAGKTLGRAFETSGDAGFNRTAGDFLKKRACTMVPDNSIPMMIGETLGQWGYQHRYLTLMRATLFTRDHTRITVYVFFEVEGT